MDDNILQTYDGPIHHLITIIVLSRGKYFPEGNPKCAHIQKVYTLFTGFFPVTITKLPFEYLTIGQLLL